MNYDAFLQAVLYSTVRRSAVCLKFLAPFKGIVDKIMFPVIVVLKNSFSNSFWYFCNLEVIFSINITGNHLPEC
jgi:hypothetical protein